MAFKRIDKGLSQHYVHCGRNDYYDADGNGKFMVFVNVNQFDEKNIDLELGDNVSAKDCLFIEMDDEFPLINTNQNINNKHYSRNDEIFKILQYCYKYGVPPKPNTNDTKIERKKNKNKTRKKKHKIKHPNTMNGFVVNANRMDPIARILLMGVYDDNNNLSIFIGMRYIIEKIWKLAIDHHDNSSWKPFINTDKICMKEIDNICFPKPTDININMMPFVMSYSFDGSKLPRNLKSYWPMIMKCINSDTSQLNKIGFLTIHECYVDAGRSQRRPGVHVETPGKAPVLKGGGRNKKLIHTYFWGVGGYNVDEHGYRHHVRGYQVLDGIYMASSVNNSCAIWNCKIVKNQKLCGDREVIGHLGDIEHLRLSLPSDKKYLMRANKLYWITDRTPHEALAINKKIYRQFFRLVTHKVSIWYKMHSTPNPNGVEPDPKITRIVTTSKFT